MTWHITDNRADAVALRDIPEVPYAEFYAELDTRLADPRYHVAHYFALPDGDRMRFICLLLDDAEHRVLIASHTMDYYDEGVLPSLTARHPALHPFERDITERYGIRFDGMPWDKPLRFPADGYDRRSSIDNYPFYTMEGHSLHEVNVGPIHAGIIEPGAFRFICNGEQVLHLEIALGYQHRGVEAEFVRTENRLRQACLAESIAGDSAVAHATAFAAAIEKLTAVRLPEALEIERTLALELERMAMQIADTGALSMDVGYQLGQVACEALRTMTINTTQAWCGNRFGKGLLRPGGTDHPLDAETTEMIRRNVREIARRYDEVRHDPKSSPPLLARFEQCGTGPREAMPRIGGVGPGSPRERRRARPARLASVGMLRHAAPPRADRQTAGRRHGPPDGPLPRGAAVGRLHRHADGTARGDRLRHPAAIRLHDTACTPLAGLRADRRVARRDVPRRHPRRGGAHRRLPRQGPEPAQLDGAGSCRARRGYLRFPDLQQEFQPLLLRARFMTHTAGRSRKTNTERL